MQLKKFNPRPDLLLAAIILVFVAAKLSSAFMFHDVRWDEAVNIGMGKYLYSAGSSGLWEQIRPVVLPFFLGVFWKLKLDIVFFSELLMISFSAGTMILTYLIGKKLFSKTVGLAAASLLAATPLFFYYSPYAFTMIPSAFFALAAVYSFISRRIWLAGLFSALAFMTRFTQGLLLVGFLIAIAVSEKDKIKQAGRFLASYCIFSLPFLAFNYFMYGNAISPFLSAVLHQGNINYSVLTGTLISYVYNFLYYLFELFKDNLLLLFSVFGFYLAIRKKQKLLVILLALFLIYYTAIINKQQRFALDFLPLVCILSAYGLYSVAKFFSGTRTNLKLVYSGVLICFVIVSAFFVINKDIEQYRWRPVSEPEIYSDFYKYFEGREVNGFVLTANPVPSVYSDSLFVPFYNNVDDAESIYSQLGNEASYIIYTTDFYPCLDDSCAGKREAIFRSISQTRKIVLNYSQGQDYYVFE